MVKLRQPGLRRDLLEELLVSERGALGRFSDHARSPGWQPEAKPLVILLDYGEVRAGSGPAALGGRNVTHFSPLIIKAYDSICWLIPAIKASSPTCCRIPYTCSASRPIR